MTKYEILAGFASSLSLFAFLSIVQRIYSSKKTNSITTISLVSNFTAQCMLLFYSLQNNLKGLMYPILIYLLGLTYIIYVKIIENQEYM